MAEHVTKEKRRSFRVIPYTSVVKYPLTPDCEVIDISPHGMLLEMKVKDLKLGNLLSIKFPLFDFPFRGKIVRFEWAKKNPQVAVEFDERSRLMAEPLVNFAREHAIRYVSLRLRESWITPQLPSQSLK